MRTPTTRPPILHPCETLLTVLTHKHLRKDARSVEALPFLVAVTVNKLLISYLLKKVEPMASLKGEARVAGG
ncbi:hypothetical protein [Altibacter lentus]|uniref:hypothetical protein n=1 Tax=Altibacter lentus TaxID=1223410 RepID=UPI0012686817|nr:hypothetical protein [Altibacter lentus]